MSGDNKSRSFSDGLVLGDSEKGVVITGIKDDTLAAKSGLQAGDEIVAATIHLDHLNKSEVMSILKVLEPYDDNMKVLTKKQLNASAGLGSLGLDLKDPAKMLNLKKDLSLDALAEAPVVSLDDLRGKLNAAKGVGGGIGGPTLNGDLPSLSLDKPSADGGAKFTMPSLGLSGADIKGDLDGSLKAPDVSVSTPKLNTPSASLNIEKPEIKTGNLKYKAPKFAMPHFNMPQLKTPKAKMDVSGDADLPSVSGNLETPDLNLPAPKLDLKIPDLNLNGPKVDLNSPGINLESPNADLEAPSSKIKWPHFKWISPKVKGPDTDLNADLTAPDFSLTTPKIDGDLSAPDIDVNFPRADIKGTALGVQNPNIDIDGQSGKIHWPHKKWKKPRLHGPRADLDLDTNLNSPYVDSSLPKVDGEINGPDVDINLPKADLESPDLDMHSGKVNWPHLKWKKPKRHGPKADLDIDADLNTPNLNVSTPKIEGDIIAPNADLNLPKAGLNSTNVDVQAPDLDIDGTQSQINWPHLKWKKPKLHGPKADMDLNADLSTPDVDLSVPNIDGEISTPDVNLNLPKDDVDFKAPNVDIEAQSGKFKWPTIKKWSVSGPKVNGLDADVDVSAPDLNGTVPKIDGEINAPDVNLNLPKADLEGPNLDINVPDVEGPSGKLKWFNFKKFGTLKRPKGDLDLIAPDLSAPNIEGGIETPDFNIGMPKLDVKGPDVDLNDADIDPDINSLDGKLKLPKFKLPKFKAPNVKGPELDADLRAPDIDGSLDLPHVDLKSSGVPGAPKYGLDAPDFDIDLPKADLKGPGVDLQAPELNALGGKIKIPKINLPKFGLPRVKGTNLDVDAKAPNLNLSAPTFKGDLSTPHLDLDADLKTDIDLSAPKTNISVPDVNLSTPNTKVPHVNLNLPKADIKGPSMDLPTAEADLQVPDLNLKAPDLSLSSGKMDGNLSAPNIDIKLLKTELEAPVTLKAPNVDIDLPKANLKGPDAQLKTPDLDFESHLGDFNLPHFKLPKLGLSSTEVDVPSIHPSVEAGIKAPKVNIGTPMGDIKGPEAPNVDANIEKSGFKFPNFNFLGPKIKAAEVNTSANLENSPDVKIKAPSVEGGIRSPDVNVSAPEVKTSLIRPELDITAEADAEVKGSPKSKLRWPFKWGFKSDTSTDDDASGVDSDTEMEVPLFKIHRLPRNSIDVIGGIDDTLSLSKLDSEAKDYVVSKGIRLPIVNATSKAGEKIDIMERLKMAKDKVPAASVSPTEAETGIDLNIAAPSLDVSASTETDYSLMRGGTFKVEKPESALGLVAPEISTSDENDKLSLSLSNMLGLNIKH